MKFVPMRDFRIRPGQVCKDLAKDEDLVITSKGQPVGLVIPVNGKTLEEKLLARRQERLQEGFARLREHARRHNVRMTMEEIDALIDQTRQEARKGRTK